MKRRELIALAAVGIHISIGSVYAWSVLTKPIMKELGVGLKDVQWTFSLAILFLGLSAAFLGKLVEHRGPRVAGLVSAACFTVGMLGAGVAIAVKSLPLLYLFYGVIGGIGLGVGYITPVSTLVKWFPENRGFATGCAIMGFGFASLVAGPVMQGLLERVSLSTMFLCMGLVYCAIMVPSARYLAPPRIASAQALTEATCPLTGLTQVSAYNAVRTWQFYALWFVLFINITCGIGLLSVASPMAQEVVGMSPMAAAAMVGVIGLVNGFGRLAWSSLSDFLGRANTYIAFFVIQPVAFYLLTATTDEAAFKVLVFSIMSCYGGGFATIPAFLSDLFGTRELGVIHGRILTAWAAAGVVGPLLVAWVKEVTGNYIGTLLVFAVAMLAALGVAVLLRVKQPVRHAVAACASDKT